MQKRKMNGIHHQPGLVDQSAPRADGHRTVHSANIHAPARRGKIQGLQFYRPALQRKRTAEIFVGGNSVGHAGMKRAIPGEHVNCLDARRIYPGLHERSCGAAKFRGRVNIR